MGMSQIEKFEAGYMPEPNTGCWLWTKAQRGGYGILEKQRNKKRVMAHRFSYEKFNGEIPVGFYILHKCDTPACVNPQHLKAGTPAENNKDCVERKRHKFGRHLYRDLRFCKRGHEYTEKTAYIRRNPDGSIEAKECRTCRNLYRGDRPHGRS